MRCRRVRSLLSAACFDELTGRRQLLLREHLSSCSTCRREASHYASIKNASADLPTEAVTDDFNTRLLNRIAQERFLETRTKAYQVKRAPLLMWNKVVPVVASAVVIALVTVSMFSGSSISPGASYTSTPTHIDDRYLTAQPDSNPNLRETANLEKDWTLDRQLAKIERLHQRTRHLTDSRGFSNLQLTGNRQVPQNKFDRTMAPRLQFQMKPGYRVYRIAGRAARGESVKAY